MSNVITPEAVVQKYVETKDLIDRMEKEFNSQLQTLRDLQEKREAWLTTRLGLSTPPADGGAFLDPATNKVVIGDYPKKIADWVVQCFVEDRDRLAELSKAASEISGPLVESQTQRGTWLKTELNTTGAEGLKTAHGTAFWETTVSTTVADAQAFMAWVHEDWEGRRGFLTNVANKTAVKDRVAEWSERKKTLATTLEPEAVDAVLLEEFGPSIPPGVNYTTFRDVKVRRK